MLGSFHGWLARGGCLGRPPQLLGRARRHLLLVAVVGALLAGCDGIGSTAEGTAEPLGNQAVYARIDSLGSCPALQRELDAARSNAERVQRVEAGDRLLDIALAYAKYADERLREIGCYD